MVGQTVVMSAQQRVAEWGHMSAGLLAKRRAAMRAYWKVGTMERQRVGQLEH